MPPLLFDGEPGFVYPGKLDDVDGSTRQTPNLYVLAISSSLRSLFYSCRRITLLFSVVRDLGVTLDQELTLEA